MGAEENCTEAPGTEAAPDWANLLRETQAFAQLQIDRHYWRGERGGVLPDGYDASSIAAEAVREVLREDVSVGPDVSANGGGPGYAGKLPPSLRGYGGTGRRGEGGLQWRLNRWVFRIVGRLNHRKETKAMRNELDLPLQPLSNCGQGEMGTVAESVPAPSVEAEGTAEEDQKRLERLRAEINDRLGADKRARAVFECMCGGVLRNGEIAKALTMTEKAVKTARRRIKRRMAELKLEGWGGR